MWERGKRRGRPVNSGIVRASAASSHEPVQDGWPHGGKKVTLGWKRPRRPWRKRVGACSCANDKPSVGAAWLVPRGFVRKRNGDPPSQQPGSTAGSQGASARIDVLERAPGGWSGTQSGTASGLWTGLKERGPAMGISMALTGREKA